MTQYKEVITKGPLSTNSEQVAQTRAAWASAFSRPSKPISGSKTPPTSSAGYQWEFNVIQDKQENAWCMPGGKVAVYTGILPITQGRYRPSRGCWATK